MPKSGDDVSLHLAQPSLGAVTYQARVLVSELNAINNHECPEQAIRFRELLLSIAEYIRDELIALEDPTSPTRLAGPAGPARVRGLARIVQKLYTCIGHLRASAHLQSPPAVQVALTDLTGLYLPQTGIEPISLVVPQWEYNLSYIPIAYLLKEWLQPGILDPTNKLKTADPEALIEALWLRRESALSHSPSKAPLQIAVLSFAGLDTHDVLLYPLLAHELGHFIDFSSKLPLHTTTQNINTPKSAVSQVVLKHKLSLDRDLERARLDVAQKTFICIRELFADLLAVRMLGVAFFVAQAEFLKTTAAWTQPTLTASGYPGIRLRLSTILDHLLSPDYPGNIYTFLTTVSSGNTNVVKPLLQYLDRWRDQLKSTPTQPRIDATFDSDLRALAEAAAVRALPHLHQLARRTVPNSKCPRLTDRFFLRIRSLLHQLPPSCPVESPHAFAEIMAAAWAYQLLYGESQERAADTLEDKYGEYSKTARLILKAVELIPTTRDSAISDVTTTVDGSPTSNRKRHQPGVLSGAEIRRRLALGHDDERKLRVVPCDLDAVQGASLDLKLGHWFVVARRVRIPKLNLTSAQDRQLWESIGREETYVPRGGTFLIHPGDFVLGATLEFVALPADVMAFVEGRSGIGRRGLLIATATQVAPGFHGVIVLELANTGTVPLEMEPEMRIAQLVLQRLTEPADASDLYKGRFNCQIKP